LFEKNHHICNLKPSGRSGSSNMKFLYFFFFGENFGLPGSGSGFSIRTVSADLIESGFNPVPKRWAIILFLAVLITEYDTFQYLFSFVCFCRIPRTSSSSSPTRRCSLSSVQRTWGPSAWPSSWRPTSPRWPSFPAHLFQLLIFSLQLKLCYQMAPPPPAHFLHHLPQSIDPPASWPTPFPTPIPCYQLNWIHLWHPPWLLWPAHSWLRVQKK
jgi:hypothetical protein